MDRKERMDIPLVALREAFRGFAADLWTALPCTVVSYDPAKVTVSLQPTIQAKVQNKEGEVADVTLPVLPDVPVQFPGAGGMVVTFPIQEGDEGIAVFSARCIDAFWQSGGVQPQAEMRMHDLSDAMFLPGSLSQSQKVSSPSADSMQLRAADGETVVDLKSGRIRCTADNGATSLEVTPGQTKVTGNLVVEGNMQISGDFKDLAGTGPYNKDIKTSGDVIAKVGAGQVALSTHTHTQPNDSHGDVESPTAAPTGGT